MYTSDHQFGFKKCHSTDMCVFTFKDSVGRFTAHGSPVYLSMRLKLSTK